MGISSTRTLQYQIGNIKQFELSKNISKYKTYLYCFIINPFGVVINTHLALLVLYKMIMDKVKTKQPRALALAITDSNSNNFQASGTKSTNFLVKNGLL